MREIILDTETTGLRPGEGHKIIEIAALEIIDFIPTGKTYHQYINPERDVPQTSTDIHGITSEFLYDKPTFKKVADEFIQYDLTQQESFEDILNVDGNSFDEIYQFAADMGGAGYIFSGEYDADIMSSSCIININFYVLILKICSFDGISN